MHRWCAALLTLWWLPLIACNYLDGEIVSASRRGQYHAVAIPIPKPVALNAGPLKYKIQFAFSDRLYSPWIQIMGKGSYGVPVVLMELEHIGNVLKAVRAEVVPVNKEYMQEHQQILREFQNATLWPKHLLVHYTWRHTNPINVDWGLYFVFLTGIATSGLLAVSVIASYQHKLKAFVSDLASDEGLGEASNVRQNTAWQKAE